jgi:hypothetical protein
MRRYKRKLKSHGTGAGNGSATDIAYTVVAAVGDDEDEVPEDFAPAIVAESTMALKTMSVASAVVELDTKDSPVFVFRNAGNDTVNIVIAGRTAISAGSTPLRHGRCRAEQRLPPISRVAPSVQTKEIIMDLSDLIRRRRSCRR